MLIFLITVSAVLGLAVGSFVNVMIARIPAGASVVSPRSACPGCGHAIRPTHNIPVVSYVLLRGRCADCRMSISIQYPMVELVTALLFVGAALWARRHIGLFALPTWWYFIAIGVALVIIDIQHHRLPNRIVIPSYPAVALLLTVASLGSDQWTALARAGLGAVALFGFYLLLVLIYPAGMGWGDVKLAGVIGAVLGYVSWSAVLVGAFAAFVLGAIYAIGLMLSGRGNGKTAVPFGPFMLVGAVVGGMSGSGLAGLYGTMIGL